MNYTIYSKPSCGYCEQAKALLTAKGLSYNELIIDVGQVKLEDQTYVTVSQLREVVPTAQTVPQILLGDRLIGGFDALKKELS